MKFRGNFEIIGNLKIVNNLDKNGNGGLNSSSWNFIKDFFTHKINSILPNWGQNTFKLKAIIIDEQ